jgi:hypothetical protein
MATASFPPIIPQSPQDEMDCLLLIIQALMRINGNLEKLLEQGKPRSPNGSVRMNIPAVEHLPQQDD